MAKYRMLYYVHLLRAVAWWAYASADARYRENYWTAVAANQTWYTIVDHLTQHPGDPGDP